MHASVPQMETNERSPFCFDDFSGARKSVSGAEGGFISTHFRLWKYGLDSLGSRVSEKKLGCD